MYKSWGRVVIDGHNLLALVESGLTDLPKSGGRGVRVPLPLASDIPEFNIQGAKAL